MRESSLERRIKRYAESKNCFFWKFVAPGTKGVPDRIIITPDGVTGFMEIKAPGKKPREIQEHRMQQIRSKGLAATWASNYELAVAFIDGLCSPKL